MKLPAKLKSGRRLVATAAAGRVGLYWGGTDAPEDWRILLPNKRIKRGKATSRGHPLAPDGKWSWLPGKKPGKTTAKKHQPGAKALKAADKVAKRMLMSDSSRERVVLPSSTSFCVDCRKGFREKKHWHEVLSEAGFPRSICCRCVRARGLQCIVYLKQKNLKKKKVRRAQ